MTCVNAKCEKLNKSDSSALSPQHIGLLVALIVVAIVLISLIAIFYARYRNKRQQSLNLVTVHL